MKLTPQQSGKLGGLTAAHNMTPEERRARAMKGGDALKEKYGKAHFVRAAFKSHEARRRNRS